MAAYAAVSEDPARAVALPGAAYTDPSVLEAECEWVLRAGWLPVARLDQLAHEGDYACTDVAGAPVVALRDRTGMLRVLSAVCRHRGMPVVSGEGRTVHRGVVPLAITLEADLLAGLAPPERDLLRKLLEDLARRASCQGRALGDGPD